MDKYVDHLYCKTEALFRRELPDYPDFNAVACYAQSGIPKYMRLQGIVAKNLAVHVWEHALHDTADFDAYLQQDNPALGQQIQLVMNKRKAYFAHLEIVKHDRKLSQHASEDLNHQAQNTWPQNGRQTRSLKRTPEEHQQWKKHRA